MQIANFDALVEIMQKENVPFRADRDNQIVELAVHTGPLHTEMVIRWESRLVLAQFIVAFPYRVPDDVVANKQRDRFPEIPELPTSRTAVSNMSRESPEDK